MISAGACGFGPSGRSKISATDARAAGAAGSPAPRWRSGAVAVGRRRGHARRLAGSGRWAGRARRGVRGAGDPVGRLGGRDGGCPLRRPGRGGVGSAPGSGASSTSTDDAVPRREQPAGRPARPVPTCRPGSRCERRSRWPCLGLGLGLRRHRTGPLPARSARRRQGCLAPWPWRRRRPASASASDAEAFTCLQRWSWSSAGRLPTTTVRTPEPSSLRNQELHVGSPWRVETRTGVFRPRCSSESISEVAA